VTGSPATAIMREGQIAEYVNQLGPVFGQTFRQRAHTLASEVEVKLWLDPATGRLHLVHFAPVEKTLP